MKNILLNIAKFFCSLADSVEHDNNVYRIVRTDRKYHHIWILSNETNLEMWDYYPHSETEWDIAYANTIETK